MVVAVLAVEELLVVPQLLAVELVVYRQVSVVECMLALEVECMLASVLPLLGELPVSPIGTWRCHNSNRRTYSVLTQRGSSSSMSFAASTSVHNLCKMYLLLHMECYN